MRANRHSQVGSFMLEALIGIIIFFIGALAMIALQANGIAAQTDAQYRIEASNLVNRIISEINVGVDRSNPTNMQTTLANYAYNINTSSPCDYSGGASGAAPAAIGRWNTDTSVALPSSLGTMRQILISTANNNRVTVTICWQAAADTAPRRHSVVAYIN